MLIRLKNWFNLRWLPARLALLATVALSAYASGSATRKVWSTPEIIDNPHRRSGPGDWRLALDGEGNAIFAFDDSDRVWANRYTVDRGWEKPVLIDDMAHPTEETRYGEWKANAQIFPEAGGNVLAVWHQYADHSTPRKTWTNRYTAGAGWGRAEKFNNTPGDRFPPEIAGDARGNAIAVWTHNDDKRDHHQLLARIQPRGAGWGPNTVIAEHAGDARLLMVKMDVLGNAYAVWLQGRDKSRDASASSQRLFNVWASRYTAGSGWGPATLIGNDVDEGNILRLATDARGNALLMWQRKERDSRGIWTNQYRVDGGWGQSQRISPEDKYGDFREPVIAFDTQGNAMVMWWRAVGDVYARRYTPAEGWGPVAVVSTRTKNAMSPRLVFDRDGSALAVWAQHDAIQGSRYTVGAGWSPPVLLSEDSREGKTDPQIAMDAEGNAIVVWRQLYRGASIWANRYEAGKGWQRPTILHTDRSPSASRAKVAFDVAGNAHVTWTQMPGERQSYRVWTRRYLPVELSSRQAAQREAPKPPPRGAANARDKYGNTPLHGAVSAGRRSVIEDLLARGADIHETREDGSSLLHAAAYQGNPEIVELLIAKGLDVNIKGFDEKTPLHVAANHGRKEAVELLIAKGANVNARDRHGTTPLHEAAAWGARDVVEILIAKGATVNFKHGNTPLHNAATRGKTDIVELLIAKGAEINAVRDGSTPLGAAVFENHEDIVRLLLSKGAVTNPPGGDATTPLHWAVDRGNGRIVELLLAHGAAVNAANSVGQTPLHVAMYKKHTAIAALLVAKGADVNARTTDGDTPLHMARERQAAELLIARGADLNAKGKFGYTPLHRAADENRKDVAELLIARKADINAKDARGKTALDAALHNYHQAIVSLLQAHGAKRGSGGD